MNKNIFKIKTIKKIPYYCAEHCFGLFIVLLLFVMVCSGFLFYKYSARPKIEDLDALLRFDEKTYNEILQTWDEQKQKIEQSEFKQYPSLFQGEHID